MANPDLSGACVLQVIPALETGGAERTTLEVARGVTRAGGRSLVASEGGRLVARLEAEGSRHVTLPMASKNPLVIAQNRGALRDLVHEEAVSLVHARSRAPAWPALWVARVEGLPFVTTYHGAYGGKSRPKRLYNSVMARGDVVIANSAFTAAAIRGGFAGWSFMEGRQIVVIPRGADLSAFQEGSVTPERLAAVAAAFGEGGLRVLLPGRLTGWKGQAVMIEAARLLQSRGSVPALRVVLAGSAQGRDGYERGLREMIEQAGLTDAVTIAGHWDDMPAAYAWADVVVSASTRPEAFGRVAVEAMAMGRPVVATDHGGSRETVRDGETGLLVPPGDAQALADGVEALADAGLRARLGAAGQVRARRFTTEAMVSATLNVYDELLAPHGAGGA